MEQTDNAKTEPVSDGRHQRSERSRQQIIAALFSLIRNGQADPSAASVAEEANVGLRSVFRHFEDMDSLYREMTREIEAQIMPMISKPFVSPCWQEKFAELIHRRSCVFEEIFPLRLSAMSKRFQSQYLAEDHARFVAIERSSVAALIPGDIKGREALVHALDLVLCFEAWHRLRTENGLTVEAAKAVQLTLVNRMIEGR